MRMVIMTIMMIVRITSRSTDYQKIQKISHTSYIVIIVSSRVFKLRVFKKERYPEYLQPFLLFFAGIKTAKSMRYVSLEK